MEQTMRKKPAELVDTTRSSGKWYGEGDGDGCTVW
jgi:hypothetical protein